MVWKLSIWKLLFYLLVRLYADLCTVHGRWGPVHTSPFSFENEYLFIRFHRSSTLKRSKTKMFIYENRGLRKRFPEWRLLKTHMSIILVWTAKTELFKNAYVTTHYARPIVSLAPLEHAYRTSRAWWQKRIFGSSFFSSYSVDSRKWCENASVDVELFIRFRVTKNGGFQKCISVDRAWVRWFFF